MRGQEHLAFGLVSAGVVIWGVVATGAPLPMSTAAAGVGAVALGSLAPDIDHPHSLIGNRFPITLASFGLMFLLTPFILRVSSADGGMLDGVFDELLRWSAPMAVGGLLVALLGVGMLVLSGFITQAVTHRGPLHSLAAAASATVLPVVLCTWSGVAPLVGLMFGLGWVTHLMADALTATGLPALLWPVSVTEGGSASRLFGVLLLPTLILGVVGWQKSWDLLSPPEELSVTASAAAPVTADVGLARQRLREVAPDIERTLQNADHPLVTSNARGTAYTWRYLRSSTTNGTRVATITITIDSVGRVVGANGQ